MTAAPGLMLFDTPIGRCGIAWAGCRIRGLQLPEASEEMTRRRLLRMVPIARPARPPAEVRDAVAQVVALLEGEPRDLGTVELDMTGVPPFHRRVYEATREIPPGSTRSYGQIAARLDAPGTARAVGQALGRNPFAIIVPCHRVLATGRGLGGFSAAGGVATKLRLLAIEGVILDKGPTLFAHFGVAPGSAAPTSRRSSRPRPPDPPR